jgi:hypothetical protein
MCFAGVLWSPGQNSAGSPAAYALIIRYLASRNFDASVPFGGDMKAALGKVLPSPYSLRCSIQGECRFVPLTTALEGTSNGPDLPS